MLKVNGEKAEILKTEFKLAEYSLNGKKNGYAGVILVKFKVHDENGYFDFYIDIVKEKDITYFENKEYNCIPIDNDKEISYLEIFDTNNFYDIGTFDNEMKVKFESIEENKIKTIIEIKEEKTSIYFDDYLEINSL